MLLCFSGFSVAACMQTRGSSGGTCRLEYAGGTVTAAVTAQARSIIQFQLVCTHATVNPQATRPAPLPKSTR